uniref:Myosin K n=1 Tax=Toxoplasma gondii COUG TaxID=1074873 RepID=A0A2G8Y4Z9_TOXGO|nr:myosin K [Toxoplasma gondii COUG]
MDFPVRSSAPGRPNLEQPPETQLLADTNSFTEATDSTESDHIRSRRCLQSGTGSARVPRSPSSSDIPISVSAPTSCVETVRSEIQSSVSRRLSRGPSLPELLLERRPHSRSPLCASQQSVCALSSPVLEPPPQSPHLHSPARLPAAGLCAAPSPLPPGTLVWVPARCLVPDRSATAIKGANSAPVSASNDEESFPFLARSLRRVASPQACRDPPSSSGGCAATASPPALLQPSSSAEETPSSDRNKTSRKRLLCEDQARDQSLRHLGNADRSQPDFRASEHPFYPAEVVAAHAVRGFGVRTPHAEVDPRLRHKSAKTGESNSPEAGGDPSFVQVRLCRGTESDSNPCRGETKGDGIAPQTGQELIAPVRLSDLLLRDASIGAADDNAQVGEKALALDRLFAARRRFPLSLFMHWKAATQNGFTSTHSSSPSIRSTARFLTVCLWSSTDVCHRKLPELAPGRGPNPHLQNRVSSPTSEEILPSPRGRIVRRQRLRSTFLVHR